MWVFSVEVLQHSQCAILGPYDLRDHGIADRIAELANKKAIYCYTRNITELTVI